MIHLSAFADEISADLDEQIAVLKSENIHFLDLRSVWNTNVLDLSDQQIASVKETLDRQGVGVACIGSPIGKVPIDSSFEEHLQRFERAIELAHILQTRFIRIFSFYPAASKGGEGNQPATYRDEVLNRLKALLARVQSTQLVLLHENEKEIYGDTIASCVDLLKNCEHPQLQAAFDPANFIQCAQVPYPDAYDALQPWLRYVHVKDALANGEVVAAGEGVARWPEILERLRADGYDGFLSLEPHLALSGRYQGFSGPALFRRASQALQQMLQAMGWTYA
ncbi:sugar phosphate isomerase/epimerase [Ktedonosporobacter rubrisoli]|uniref:Sugar phosphate isomerase/epimerase n=1 Tax=Ktedonosporobacter rubrisoli TaxID=2509675 RepID=A0A4V0Z0A2_KTERU|nr:sugar phosphate isomerase/epimerase family protein [Ktedonosporobacter rubrisoli]QBD82511.1 sugar phosphate isomerase/epimerase [Ktedonosporobacter rubrisoli]